MKIQLAISTALIVGFLASVVILNVRETRTALHTQPLKNLSTMFTDWKRENNKSYSGGEHTRRYGLFSENYQRILKINSVKRNFTVGLNQFSDLSREEFSSLFLGLRKAHYISLKSLKNLITASNVEILKVGNDTVDWRAKNVVTSIKNQGQCGAGWAFSAIGSIEGYAAQYQGELTIFSEQQLIDCSESYGNQGCSGGLMTNALLYTAENGVIPDAHYKYTGIQSSCKYNEDYVTFKNGGQTSANSDEDLERAVAKRPVSISVEADQDVFQYYTSGILDSTDCGTNVNHGVLAVGYGVENGMGYWIMKNSWGSYWGDQGYLKIARASGDGICGVNTDNIMVSTSTPAN